MNGWDVVLCNVDVNIVPVVNNETVGRILHPEWSRAELCGERLQSLFVSEVNTEPSQTPAVRGCGRSTATVPHVDTQVMMIVPRRQKQSAREIALRDVKTECLVIEFFRSTETGDLEMNVAD